MIINNLETMEDIVSKNKNLYWDGWTVVNKYKSDKAKTSKFGSYIDGKWFITKRYEPNRQGWDIPESLLNA